MINPNIKQYLEDINASKLDQLLLKLDSMAADIKSIKIVVQQW
jgi:hypothetical protein